MSVTSRSATRKPACRLVSSTCAAPMPAARRCRARTKSSATGWMDRSTSWSSRPISPASMPPAAEATTTSKLPKGNLDITGEYDIWTGNAGTNRLDAFIVRIPKDRLTGGAPLSPPEPSTDVTIPSPTPSQNPPTRTSSPETRARSMPPAPTSPAAGRSETGRIRR